MSTPLTSAASSRSSRPGRFRQIGSTALVVGALAVTGAVGSVLPAAADTGSPSVISRTAPTGWVRVAHLSPTVPQVDIYLTAVNGSTSITLPKAGYGAITPYQSLKPGVYNVAMRPAGSPAGTAPVVSWTVDVKAGQAYTVAAIQSGGQLQNRLIGDDLTAPAKGKARIRLIQGAPAAKAVTVSAVGGPLLAQDVPYGATTSYADVPQGRWALKVSAAGKASATSVDVAAGGVYSLTVVQNSDGSLKLRTGGNDLLTTATGTPVTIKVVKDAAAKDPAVGGINTGLGGMAPNGPSALDVVAGSPFATPVGAGGALLLAVGAGFAFRRRRTMHR